MKILQINSLFRNGSTGKITADIHDYLKKFNFDSVVLYGRGDEITEDGVYKISSEFSSKFHKFCTFFTGNMYGGMHFQTNKAISIIKKEKPDIVHLQCINGDFINIYRILEWLKKNKYKTVLTLHAEFMHTGNCGYAFDCDEWKNGCKHCPRVKDATRSRFLNNTHRNWMKMSKVFANYKDLRVVSVSKWLMDRAVQSPILLNAHHQVIENGLDTDIFKYYDSSNLKSKFNFQNKKVIFHATASFTDDSLDIKGGRFLIELAKLYENKNDIVFLVAGPTKINIRIPSNIVLLGNVSNQLELAKYYSMADITLLVSKKETFSMPTAESLCCGTPVVGFKAGAPETICISKFCSFVDYGSITELKSTLDDFFNMTFDHIEISEMAREKYNLRKMTNAYIDVYRSMVVHE